MSRNTLFLVYDQLRADVLRGPLAAHVPTPNFDRLAAQSVVWAQHRTAMVPCGPSRASLLTGLPGPAHGAVMNGMPLRAGTPTLATRLRQLGVEPLLFGYTDIAPDPAVHHPRDPALASYEGVAEGFREVVEMRWETGAEWPGWLARQGVALPRPWPRRFLDLYRTQDGTIRGPVAYRADQSETAYLTDRVIEGLEARRDHPWFAHVTYIRPHPPFAAPAPWNRLVDADALPPPAKLSLDHPFFAAWHALPSNGALFHGFDGQVARLAPDQVADLRAVYLGLVAECDHHLGRLLDWLEVTGQDAHTDILLTGDHGEMLGDYGLWGKDCVFDAAWHVPLMIRRAGQTPHVETALTSSLDIMPTLLGWYGDDAPASVSPADAAAGQGRALDAASPDLSRQVQGFVQLSHPDAPSRFATTAQTRADGLSAHLNWRSESLSVHFSNGWPELEISLLT